MVVGYDLGKYRVLGRVAQRPIGPFIQEHQVFVGSPFSFHPLSLPLFLTDIHQPQFLLPTQPPDIFKHLLSYFLTFQTEQILDFLSELEKNGLSAKVVGIHGCSQHIMGTNFDSLLVRGIHMRHKLHIMVFGDEESASLVALQSDSLGLFLSENGFSDDFLIRVKSLALVSQNHVDILGFSHFSLRMGFSKEVESLDE